MPTLPLDPKQIQKPLREVPHRTMTPTNTVQTSLFPHQHKKQTTLYWTQSITKTGKPCEKAFIEKNCHPNGQPIQAYLDLRRIIQVYIDNNQKPVFDGYLHWISWSSIGRMENNY